MAYFGGIFYANMGGGGGQNYFQNTVSESMVSKTELSEAFWPSPSSGDRGQ